MKSPQQAIFDACYSVSLKNGYSTYDYLPPNKTEYPIVIISEQFSNDEANKTSVAGYVTQRINVYNVHTKRSETTDMINNIRRDLRNIKKVEGYNVRINYMSDQLLIDNSTTTPLSRGFLEIEFKFN